MNSVLKRESDMEVAAQMQPLPKRFKSRSGPVSSQRIVIDTETGRSVTVGLGDYHSVRKALNAFFGDT